jgi:hypothetical protein
MQEVAKQVEIEKMNEKRMEAKNAMTGWLELDRQRLDQEKQFELEKSLNDN